MLEKSWFSKFFHRSVHASQQELQQRADQAGPDAQNNLGAFLSNSDRQDGAIISYRKAAESGHAMAQSNLGLMYTTGDGVGRDDAQAQHWFGRAAAQGYATAQFHLGRRWHRASLTLPDGHAREARIEAFKWLQLASAQGFPNADSSREQVNIAMSGEDVAEGNRRIGGFVVTPEQPKAM
jgi:TPR repeat protein